MYLTGAYQHNLDAKLRLTLPASFRKQFGDVVCLVPVGDAIYGFAPEEHEAWVMSYFPQGFNARSKADQDLRWKLNKRTVTVDIDNAGRISLGKISAQKLERRGINRAVAVIGNADHFEIWNADLIDFDEDDDLDDLMFDAE